MNMGSGMAMDLNDIDYDAFLANDRTLDDPELIRTNRAGASCLRLNQWRVGDTVLDRSWCAHRHRRRVDGHLVRPVRGTRSARHGPADRRAD